METDSTPICSQNEAIFRTIGDVTWTGSKVRFIRRFSKDDAGIPLVRTIPGSFASQGRADWTHLIDLLANSVEFRRNEQRKPPCFRRTIETAPNRLRK